MNRLIYRCLRLLYITRRWLWTRFTPMGLGVLGCLVVTGLVGLGSTQSMCHVLFFFAAALLGLAAISNRAMVVRYKAMRTLPRFGTVGEPLYYEVQLQLLSSQAQRGAKLKETIAEVFPSFQDFLNIRERCPADKKWIQVWRTYVARQQWAIAPLVDLPPLSPETKTRTKGELLPLRRGRLNLDGLDLVCVDPLGLIYTHHHYPFAQSLCILPQRYRLPPLRLSNPKQRNRGNQCLVPSAGESLEFRSLREYRPGDPTQKIHWKSWAKVGRPIVKEQQEETGLRYGMVLDTFHSDRYSEVFEVALAIAISFLTQDRPEESVLDVIFAAQEARCITVGQGLRHRGQILETLATLTPCYQQNLASLTPALQAQLSTWNGCFCIFLDTDASRYACLDLFVQQDVPTKAIFLCEGSNLATEPEPYYRSPQCRTHYLSITQIQQELLSI